MARAKALRGEKAKITFNPSSPKINESKNLMFRSGLFIVATLALFFVAVMIFWIVYKAIAGFATYEELQFGYFLFGNYYDGIIYFAAGFMVVNTIWTSFLAMIIALPISVLTAVFIARIVPKGIRPFFIATIVILAAIPSVIYGAFGQKVINSIFAMWGLQTGTVLAIVITLTMMILPTMTMMSTTAIVAVDKQMENSSLALGATKSQTSFFVTIKAASGGILAGALLGIGRAIGEATAVSMVAAAPSYGPTFGLFDNIRLLTATMLTGFLEVTPGTLQEASIFAMAMLLLFTVIIVFGVMKWIEKKYNIKEVAKRETEKNKLRNELYLKVNTKGIEVLSTWEKYQYEYFVFEQQQLEKELKKAEEKYINETKYLPKTINPLSTVSYNATRQKKQKSALMNMATIAAAMVGVLILISIIAFLFVMGSSAFTWDFLTNPDTGIIIPLLNTIVLIGLTWITLIPLGILTGIYFVEYAKDNKTTRFLSSSVDLLSGIPSLLFGIVGATIILPFVPENFVSLAASLTLTFMLMPTIIKATENALKEVKRSQKEGSLALGATKSQTSLKVSMPQSLPMIISGVILATGRIIAESSALIIILGTASYDNVSDSVTQGGVTLATYIWALTSQDVVQWDLVAATGIVILILILLLAIISQYVEKKSWRWLSVLLIGIALLLTGLVIANYALTIFAITSIGTIILLETLWSNKTKVIKIKNKIKVKIQQNKKENQVIKHG